MLLAFKTVFSVLFLGCSNILSQSRLILFVSAFEANKQETIWLDMYSFVENKANQMQTKKTRTPTHPHPSTHQI